MAISTSSNRGGNAVAFSSTAPLTPDAPPLGTSAVYAMWNGELELVSRLPDGSVATQATYMANASKPTAGAKDPPAVAHRNQVAGQGRFVLFRGPLGLGGISALYVRDLERQVTHQLAGGAPGTQKLAMPLDSAWGGAGQTIFADLITVPEGGQVFAARDGARAYFKEEKSLNEAALVHEVNLETGSVTARPAITGPPLQLSPDGRRMLFLAPPTVPVGNGTAQGDWTLKYWDAASPDSSITVGTVVNTSSNPPFGMARVYRSSADGSTWIFTAIGSPDPVRPNVAPNTQQLYRWTVGDSRPMCLTCQPIDGVARTSGVNLTVQETIATEEFGVPTVAGSTGNAKFGNHKRKLAQPGHSLSSDGRWLLFDSPDRLTAGDTNDVRDVYLWDRDGAPDGELQLVTSGLGTMPSYAVDLDPTGRNAFFTTREGLVPADQNGNYNVYTARIGGGFPGPPNESCVGEACRPPVIPDPPRGPIGSSVLGAAPVGPKVGVQQGTPKFRVRSVQTSARRLTVRVDTPGEGKIRVSGKQVRTTNRTAKRATTYKLRVPLSSSARRRVARGNTVKVRLQVRFTPKGSKKSERLSPSVSVKQRLRVGAVRSSSGRLTVPVEAPGAGEIRVSGKHVRTRSRTAKRAATYRVRVPLSTSDRRRVADGKTVKVRLRVRFTPKGSKKSTRVSSMLSVRKGR